MPTAIFFFSGQAMEFSRRITSMAAHARLNKLLSTPRLPLATISRTSTTARRRSRSKCPRDTHYSLTSRAFLRQSSRNAARLRVETDPRSCIRYSAIGPAQYMKDAPCSAQSNMNLAS
jgi:hypothetical protein